MKLRVATLTLFCIAVLGMSGGGGGDRIETVSGETHPGLAGPGGDPAAPGMVVHFDPATGEIVETPSAQALKDLAAALAPVMDSSDEGLRIEQSTVPGGGIMIDLQGRFQNTAVAAIDENGKLEAPCLPGAPVTEKGGE